MPSNFSRTPFLLKGALVEFSSRFIGPVPNVIIFQYNPESLSRKFEAWKADTGPHPGGKKSANSSAARSQSFAQPLDPTEIFDLTLILDAADSLESPLAHPIEAVTGIADRLAALELLLYPQEESLVSGLISAVGGALGSVTGSGIGGSGAKKPVPRKSVPVVLFVWGTGRIVPVRIIDYKVEEEAFTPFLYPIRAKVSLSMKILTPSDFPKKQSTTEKIAVACYKFSKKQKETLAAANVVNDIQSILGMIPF